jgi:circadian clock protein KaiC
MVLKRIKSGIPGLDEVINGGFPLPSVLLILGDPGTGKTTFGMQSIFHGAQNGDKAIYMTGVAEPVFMIKKFMSTYKFFDQTYIENGKIQFWDLGTSIQTMGPKKALDAITDIVRETKVMRVVIDPLPLAQIFASQIDYRRYLYEFLTALRNLNVFTIIVGEKASESATDLEAYMVDAVIILHLKSLDSPLVYKNLMRIRKMRGTDHTRNVLEVEMTEEGMKVKELKSE